MTQSNTISSTLKVDILDYMGKFENGIIANITICYDNNFYPGTFFYTEDTIALTIDSELKQLIGSEIEDHIEYKSIVFDLLKKVVPYNELINSIDNIDITKYIYDNK
jgi:hypothetical protein